VDDLFPWRDLRCALGLAAEIAAVLVRKHIVDTNTDGIECLGQHNLRSLELARKFSEQRVVMDLPGWRRRARRLYDGWLGTRNSFHDANWAAGACHHCLTAVQHVGKDHHKVWRAVDDIVEDIARRSGLPTGVRENTVLKWRTHDAVPPDEQTRLAFEACWIASEYGAAYALMS
jgi:hypothetical protein